MSYASSKANISTTTFATLLRQQARDVDRCGRYGGDEFVMVLAQTPEAGAVALAERVRRCAEKSLASRCITMSAGVASFPAAGDNWHGLVAAADGALYRAKRLGGNRVVAASD